MYFAFVCFNYLLCNGHPKSCSLFLLCIVWGKHIFNGLPIHARTLIYYSDSQGVFAGYRTDSHVLTSDGGFNRIAEEIYQCPLHINTVYFSIHRLEGAPLPIDLPRLPWLFQRRIDRPERSLLASPPVSASAEEALRSLARPGLSFA